MFMTVIIFVLAFELVLSKVRDKTTKPLTEEEHKNFFALLDLVPKDFEDFYSSRVSVKPSCIHISSERIDCVAENELHMKQMARDNSAMEVIKEFIELEVVPYFITDESRLVVGFKKTETSTSSRYYMHQVT